MYILSIKNVSLLIPFFSTRGLPPLSPSGRTLSFNSSQHESLFLAFFLNLSSDKGGSFSLSYLWLTYASNLVSFQLSLPQAKYIQPNHSLQLEILPCSVLMNPPSHFPQYNQLFSVFWPEQQSCNTGSRYQALIGKVIKFKIGVSLSNIKQIFSWRAC